MRLALLIAAPLLMLSASASTLAQPGAATVSVNLSNFRFAPATIRLRHGQPYVLRLTNRAKGGHDFVARQFFAAATLDASTRARVSDGGVDVPAGRTVEVRLVAPAPGRYALRCTHFMHRTFGMKGEIIVE